MAEPTPPNPNRINEAHRNAIAEFVSAGVPAGDFGEMIEFMFDNWLLIVDRAAMIQDARTRRLGDLTAERDRQDADRQALDDEIARLEGRDQ